MIVVAYKFKNEFESRKKISLSYNFSFFLKMSEKEHPEMK